MHIQLEHGIQVQQNGLFRIGDTYHEAYWWCWRVLPVAIITFVESLHLKDHHPIRIGDERERLVTASPVMTKSWGPSWGKHLLGERPRETAET
jgi:hypothetical protein